MMKHPWMMLGIGLLMLGLGRPALTAEAATPAQTALMATAQQAVTSGQWATAVTTLESFRQQYAQSPLLPDALVLLYQAYLHQPDAAKADATWQEITTRWPQSIAVWHSVEQKAAVLATHAPAEAVTYLQGILTQQLLPQEAYVFIKLLRMQYLQQADPATFLTEALALARGAKGAATADDLRLAAEMALRVYLPLLQAGRFDEAKALSTFIQEQVSLRGNAEDPIRVDTMAFLGAVEQAAPTRYLAEATPVMALAKWADTPEELEIVVHTSYHYYPLAMKAGQFTEALTIHAAVQAAFQRVGDPKNLAVQENGFYFDSLNKADAKQFLIAIQAVLAKLSPQLSQEETVRLAGSVQAAYAPLMQAGRFEDAKTAHEQLQALLTKYHLDAQATVDTHAFGDSVSISALDAMLALVKKGAAANDLPTVKKWVTQLNLIAPEAPQAIRARQILKALDTPPAPAP